VHGFDYLSLHWADKQKPLQEVAGEFGVFPQAIDAPPLVPEEIDQEAPVSAEEVALADLTLVERITVSEHFMHVEYAPERRRRPRAPMPVLAA
jgi:hypothetical protein